MFFLFCIIFINYKEAQSSEIHSKIGDSIKNNEVISSKILSHYNNYKKLNELIDITIIANSHNKISKYDLVELLSKNWSINGERNEKQTEKYNSKKFEIIKIANELGFLESRESSGNYDFAFIHGSYPNERISSLFKAIKSGIYVDKIVISTTSSVPSKCKKCKIEGYEATEIGYMKYVFDKLLKKNFTLQEAEKIKKKTIFIDTPTPYGLSRPHTGHTIIEFFKKFNIPKGSTILGVSNQPYIAYQNNIIRILAKLEGLDLDVYDLGEQAGNNIHPIIVLDSIKRAVATEFIEEKINYNDVQLAKNLLLKHTLVDFNKH
jgi:hypothetical protein